MQAASARRRCRALPGLALGLGVLLGKPLPARAHDFWLEPQRFRLEPGALLGIHAWIGDAEEAEPFPHDPVHIDRFELLFADRGGTQRQVEIVGRWGLSPAGWARPTEPGVHVVAYQSQPQRIVLPKPSFRSHLRELGLDEERVWAGADAGPVHERYVRCAKALVRITRPLETTSPGYARRASLTLEIGLRENPFALAAADPVLAVEVRLHSRPLADIRVEARPLRPAGDPWAADRPPTKVRTDARGRAWIPVELGRPWLLTAVHAEPTGPAPPMSWQSYWASLVLEPASAPDSRPAERPRGVESGARVPTIGLAHVPRRGRANRRATAHESGEGR